MASGPIGIKTKISMYPTFLQPSLLAHEMRVKSLEFSSAYSSRTLVDCLNQIEASLPIIDEEHFFGNLVNTSLSRREPYHRWARYREGFSGTLVAELIHRSNLDPRRHFIFDPMVGSGSTMVSSSQLGFDNIGSDINPYSVDLSNAKVTNYAVETIDCVKIFIKGFPQKPTILGVDRWKRLENCQAYFRGQHLSILQSIIDSINVVPDRTARRLLFVAWLTILEDCSERKKDGNGLATRPSPVRDVWLYFVSKVRMFLDDINKHPMPNTVRSLATKASAIEAQSVVRSFAKRTNKELGAIIFSPPYANSFDYFESYKIELLAGYMGEKSLIKARSQAIRNYRKGYGHPLSTNDEILRLLCEEVRSKIPEKEEKSGRIDNRTRLVPNLLIGYFEDMEGVLKALFNSMPAKTQCHIVVDQSSYVGVIIPTDILLANIAQRIGFKVQRLTYCRRATTSGQQLKQYPYLATMLRETIVSLVRP